MSSSVWSIMARSLFFCVTVENDIEHSPIQRRRLFLKKRQRSVHIRFVDTFPEDGDTFYGNEENQRFVEQNRECGGLNEEKRIRNRRVSELRSEAAVLRNRRGNYGKNSHKTPCTDEVWSLHKEEEEKKETFTQHSICLERPSDTVLRVRQQNVRKMR